MDSLEIPSTDGFITANDLRGYAKLSDIPRIPDTNNFVDRNEFLRILDNRINAIPKPEILEATEPTKLPDDLVRTDQLEEIQKQLDELSARKQLEISELDSRYAQKSDITPHPQFPDLTGFALKTDIPSTDAFITQDALGPYALQDSVSAIGLEVIALKNKAHDLPDLTVYALKTDLHDPVPIDNLATKDQITTLQGLIDSLGNRMDTRDTVTDERWEKLKTALTGVMVHCYSANDYRVILDGSAWDNEAIANSLPPGFSTPIGNVFNTPDYRGRFLGASDGLGIGAPGTLVADRNKAHHHSFRSTDGLGGDRNATFPNIGTINNWQRILQTDTVGATYNVPNAVSVPICMLGIY